MDSENTSAPMQSSGGTKISRRTVARGVAWSAPIAAVAYAAPAFAASCTPQITLGPGSCKCPGHSQTNEPWVYYLVFCITDANDCAVSAGTPFTVTEVKSNPVTILEDGGNDCYDGLAGATGTVGEGGCTPPIRFTSHSSANGLDVKFTLNGQPLETTGIPAPPNCSTVLGLETRCDACES